MPIIKSFIPSPQADSRTSPTATVPQGNCAQRGTPTQGDVGQGRHSHSGGYCQLSDAELEEHIADCNAHWRRAYDLFQQHQNPADRDEALLWLHRQNEAILARSAGVQAQRHAGFEQRLAAGVERVMPLRRIREAG